MDDYSSLTPEQIVFTLIMHAGNSKSSSLEAMKAARSGEDDVVAEKIAEAQAELLEAHNLQTSLLSSCAAGESVDVDILMVHAQDHLGGATVVLDLVLEMIEMERQIRKLEKAK